MSETRAPEEKPVPITQAELEQIAAAPAVFVNKIYITVMGTNVRFAFAERQPEGLPPLIRSAVVMPAADFMSLLALMQRTATNFQVIEVENIKQADG